MIDHSPDRLEIFLALALERGAQPNANDFMPSLDAEKESADEEISDDSADENFSPFYEYLSAPENERFRRILAEYQNKTATEKSAWRAAVRRGIGIDESFIDETIHWSNIFEALRKEVPAIQKIVAAALPVSHRSRMDFSPAEKTRAAQKPKDAADTKEISEKPATPLEKTVRLVFARKFVALRDLPSPTAFDCLSGAELARLIRLAGIREVALACVRIEAVESVAAFLRRFSAEDARAVAAQIVDLRGAPAARLNYAENLVRTVIEIEPQTSAMLDLLGIRLIGTALCRSAAQRIRYTNQKLPLEAITRLPEIIDEQRRRTPDDWQREIRNEIEHLAETVVRAGSKKSAKRKTGKLVKL